MLESMVCSRVGAAEWRAGVDVKRAGEGDQSSTRDHCPLWLLALGSSPTETSRGQVSK